MAQDRNPSQSPNSDNNRGPQNNQFESDTQRIIHRHLQNKDDVITEEDIAGVRVGMTPPELDNAGAELMQDAVAGADTPPADEKAGGKDHVTPWDTLQNEDES